MARGSTISARVRSRLVGTIWLAGVISPLRARAELVKEAWEVLFLAAMTKLGVLEEVHRKVWDERKASLPSA